MSRLFTMDFPGPITSHFLFNTIMYTEPTSAYMLCLHHPQSNTRKEYLQVYPQLYTAFTKMILSSSPSAPCALASSQEKGFNSEACLTAARVVGYLFLYPPSHAGQLTRLRRLLIRRDLLSDAHLLVHFLRAYVAPLLGRSSQTSNAARPPENNVFSSNVKRLAEINYAVLQAAREGGSE